MFDGTECVVTDVIHMCHRLLLSQKAHKYACVIYWLGRQNASGDRRRGVVLTAPSDLVCVGLGCGGALAVDESHIVLILVCLAAV